MVLDHFRNDVKDLGRLQKIVLVFFNEGLGHYILKTKLRKYLPFRKRLLPVSPLSNNQAIALHLRHAFEKLGPTFVKLGQLLSVRPDLVPAEFCKEFEKLQDQVPPFQFDLVRETIEQDLLQPLKKTFKEFERKPIASASIAQIHRAVLRSGKVVAVKVQRPNIKKIIDRDLDILFHLARALERHFPAVRGYRPVEIVKEFAFWTRKELNFEVEAGNARRLREELKQNKEVGVPEIYLTHSSPRVLTMDFVEGVPIDDLAALKELRLNREKVALTYFTSILEQALLYGFFHADPHPANIFVQRKGKLVYLDYGIMGELSKADRQKIIRFIDSLEEKDAEKSLNLILSLAQDTRKADLPAFQREALPILEEAYLHSIGERSIGSAFYQILALGARHGAIFNPNHVLMAKAVYQAEGIGLKLCPQFKVAEGLKLFSQKYLKQRYAPVAVAKRTWHSLWSNRELLADLPDHVVKIMEHLEQPEPPHQLEIEQLQELEQEWEFLNRRRSLGIIIAALILGSAILFYLEGRTSLWGLPLSMLLFSLALVLLLLWAFKKRRLSYHGTNH